MDSHNQACKGLLSSLDRIHADKLVQSIHLYEYLAKEKIQTLQLIDGQWNQTTLPSYYVNREREAQKANPEFIQRHIDLGKETLKTIEPDLRQEVSRIIEKLISFLKETP